MGLNGFGDVGDFKTPDPFGGGESDAKASFKFQDNLHVLDGVPFGQRGSGRFGLH